MSTALAIGHMMSRLGGYRFSPSALFAGGAVSGAWYDPSDLSTMFTTSAGTTPVAMPGQGAAVPVGAMLDKRATGYSLFFDGDGDYLSTPNSAALQFGTGDFTIEFWIYFASISDYQTPYDKGYSGAGGLVIQTGNGTGRMIVYASGVTVIGESGTGSTGTWIHYALVRNGSALTLYRDGVASGAATNSTDFNNAATLAIGSAVTAPQYSVNGYLSNFRIVKGTAVYTSAFTPPTAPLSPITGTSLLTCGTTWSGNPAITTVGNTRIDGRNPFTASPVGNHAIAFNNTTARPELQARVNLLTYSEDFSNPAWITDSRLTISANTTDTTDPLGGNTADKVTETTDNGTHRIYQIVTTTANATFTGSFYFKKGTRQWVWAAINGVQSANRTAFVQYFDLDNIILGQQTTTQVGGTVVATFVSANIIDAGNGWRKVTIVCTTQNTPTSVEFYAGLASADGTASYAGSTSEYGYFWGADLRPANIGANVPAYQRIADANTYDTSNFPLYLRFDGIDDSMYTPANLNLSGTDKVAVFAGVRKLVNTPDGIIAELSASVSANNGTFGLYAPSASGTATLRFASKGTIASTTDGPAGFTAPATAVVNAFGDISGDLANLRFDGSQSSSSTTDQGTGNFGTYPLFIGSRNNASAWFNGHLHSLIIAGSAVSAGNISATEQWVAGKTGIVL